MKKGSKSHLEAYKIKYIIINAWKKGSMSDLEAYKIKYIINSWKKKS